MLLVFMSALGSFSAPYIFGGGARVLATQILVSKLNGAIGLAYVETTVLAVTAVLALLLLRRLEGKRTVQRGGQGARDAAASLRSGVARTLLPPLALALVVLLVLPHAMVVLVSFARDGAWTTQIMPPEYTLDNYRRLASERQLWRPITNSIGMCAAWRPRRTRSCASLARTSIVLSARSPGRRIIAAARRAAVGDPRDGDRARARGDVRPQCAGDARVLLVGTFWILPLAYFIRNIPLVATRRGGIAAADGSDARGRGARPRRLVVARDAPRDLRPRGRASWRARCWPASTAVGEFVASVVLYTHANRPISVEILGAGANTRVRHGRRLQRAADLLVLVITSARGGSSAEQPLRPRDLSSPQPQPVGQMTLLRSRPGANPHVSVDRLRDRRGLGSTASRRCAQVRVVRHRVCVPLGDLTPTL